MNDAPIPIRATYFLHNWGYYQRQHEWLTPEQRLNARSFFYALQELPPDDVQFLAEKYLTEDRTIEDRDKPVADAELAQRHGVDIAKYRNRRVKLEKKLSNINAKQRADYASKRRELMQDYVLSLGHRLYIQSAPQTWHDTVTLTFSRKMAKVYHNGEGRDLIRIYGFTPEPEKEG